MLLHALTVFNKLIIYKVISTTEYHVTGDFLKIWPLKLFDIITTWIGYNIFHDMMN